MMKFLALTLTLLTASNLLGVEVVGEWSIKRAEYTVSDAQLVASPIWKQDAESPPLSPRAAIKHAKDAIKSFTDNKSLEESPGFYWWLAAANLECMDVRDVWYWRVRFELRPTSGGMTGFAPELDIIVMMNGDVLIPSRLVPND